MMTQEILEKYILSLPKAWRDYPFGEGVAVYKVGDADKSKMFALIQEGAQPLRVSLKCDPGLAEMLREKYETVLPGYHLNKKHWNTILCSGQLSNEEILDLVRHSYELVHPTV
ncbi:MAG TPA: MmcQ/YjbR family DNA-binding protein [Verrucomicrobiae bacterium]|nr:MmcQ/YjbR family DNA-binding protein [Verrucomicrobiae bacterium]